MISATYVCASPWHEISCLVCAHFVCISCLIPAGGGEAKEPCGNSGGVRTASEGEGGEKASAKDQPKG